jgi:hypothetical protein
MKREVICCAARWERTYQIMAVGEYPNQDIIIDETLSGLDILSWVNIAALYALEVGRSSAPLV